MAKVIVPITELIAALPKPSELRFSYPKDWSDASTGVFGALAGGEFLGAAATAAAQVGAGGAGEKASAAFFDETGTAINQRNKALFRDLPFRSVSFAWNILPTSANHAKQIKDFIYQMKLDSAPALSKANAGFESPKLSELEIRSGAGTLFRSNALALVNLSVDYAPSGFWSQHIGGMPTKINFSMEFKELALATRENLEGGEGAKLI